MKQIFVAAFALLATEHAGAQTLFTYGNNPVSKDEFLRAYNKNKTPVTDKEKSLREYLDLYTRFKLKVKAASELRLDTLQQLQYDVQNFRGQVEESYLNDEKELGRLVNEVFTRNQKDVHVLHYSIGINGKLSPADSAKNYKLLTELQEILAKPGSDHSAEINALNNRNGDIIKVGDIGYITSFSIPYEMESLVYGLKPGEVSSIYKTKSALHLFKNAGERPGAGKWKVAQLLFAVPPGSDEATKTAAKKLADSVYTVLTSGANFEAMAKQYSNDKLTYMNGGQLPEFGTGKYDQAFESAVFALKNDGDISKPIATAYGYHIVKRLQHTPPPAEALDEALMNQLKQQVLQDGRVNIAKANFLKNIKVKTGFKRNPMLKDQDLFRFADSVVAAKEVGKYPINKILFVSFTKSKVTGADWLNFVKDYKLNTDVYKGEDNKALLEKYISTVVVEYYRKHLDAFDPEFKYQMQEFKEGNMLFEVMERNVWSKAAADNDGLKKYYNANKSRYKWAESAAVILFNANSLKTAEEAAEALAKGSSWKQIADASEGSIQADSGRYEIAQLQLPENIIVKEGLSTKPALNGNDNTASFLKVLTTYPADQQRSFEEARGLVINDYQGYLEEQWIAELKKKYPVKANEAVFQSMLK